MAEFRVSGTTAATAATDQHAVAALWNPHSTARIHVKEISLVAFAAPGAGAGVLIRRISARGTAGSTVTPGIEHATDRDIAPPSGFLLDLATYSVQPTLVANSDMWGWVLAAVAASGFIYVPAGDEITIPPGTGIALVNRAAIITPTCEVSFVVED